jgi:hypothetical protein
MLIFSMGFGAFMFVFALTVQDGLRNDALRGGLAIVPSTPELSALNTESRSTRQLNPDPVFRIRRHWASPTLAQAG